MGLGMARKITTGNFTVPTEIMALKPKELNCTVKVIKTFSKTTGTEIAHYYVYEVKESKDPKNSHRLKFSSGQCIGKIKGDVFCPIL
jgi:hypothetical protein